MEDVKEFLLIFRMKPSDIHPTLEEMNKMHHQWKNFIADIASQSKLIHVSRLAFEGITLTKNSVTVNNLFVDNNLVISGHLMLKAADINEAEQIAQKCPILSVGGTVEIRPTIPMA